jgi:hypothetical protein
MAQDCHREEKAGIKVRLQMAPDCQRAVTAGNKSTNGTRLSKGSNCGGL